MAPPGDTEDKSDQDTPSRFDLRILATTDLHMHLCGHDYYADKEDPRIGLVRTASLIRTARSEAERAGKAVLLVDNGDALQGTPMADVARQMQPHPLMQAFAELKYDAFGLGNHDFDFGPDALFDILRGAPCPVISSNLRGPVKGVQASAEKVFQLPDGAGEVRVGLLSVLPPQTLQWNAHHLARDYVIDDMTTAVASKAAQLKADGCDLIIVLAHTGVALAGADDTENAVVPIAALPDVDVIVGGHTHLHLPGRAHLGLDHVDAERGLVHGKPVVMPGYGGSHLGVIDLSLQGTTQGWHINGSHVSLRSVAPPNAPAVAPDRRLQTNLAPADMQTRHVLGIPIGETRHRLHSYFSLFGPDHGLALVASAQAWAVAPFVKTAGLTDLPLLSAAAPCKFGARSGPEAYTDVPKGPMTLRHVAALNMFTDEVRLLHVTFADVLDWLEMSASLLHRVHPGRTGQMLVPEDVAGYNFDVIHGVTYQIDPTQPARYRPDGTMIDPENRRVRNLMYQGASVDPVAQCLVATNSYRCGGGGRFQMAMTAPRVTLSALEVHEAIRAYVAAAPDGQGYAPPWRLTTKTGASVEVQTGPAAAEVLDEINWLCPEDLGLSTDGFRHIRLHL